jgi:hypothetical protein
MTRVGISRAYGDRISWYTISSVTQLIQQWILKKVVKSQENGLTCSANVLQHNNLKFLMIRVISVFSLAARIADIFVLLLSV